MINQSMEEIKTNFFKLQTRTDVSEILGIDDESLRFFLYGTKPESHYTEFKIDKRNGKSRLICAPERKLKMIQKQLAQLLNRVYEPKVCAYGFIPNKNIIQNAENHAKRRLVLNIDLKDFLHKLILAE